MKTIFTLLIICLSTSIQAKLSYTFEIINTPHQPVFTPDEHVYLEANDSIIIREITQYINAPNSFYYDDVTWTIDSIPVNNVAQNAMTFRSPGEIGFLYSGHYHKCFDLHVGCTGGNMPGTPQITANSDSLCTGQTLSLNVTTLGNATSWFWCGPAGFTSTLQNPVQNNVQITQNGKWYVVATNSCGSLGTSIDIKVTDPINYTLTMNSAASNYCVGSVVDLNAQINGGSGNYSWETPSHSFTFNSHLNFVAYNLNQSGVYTFTASNACGIFDTSITLNVVYSPLTATVIQSGNVLIADHLDPSETVEWYLNNNLLPFSGDTLPCAGAGDYYFIVSNSYGCSSSSAPVSVQCSTLGILNPNDQKEIHIYPNPVKDYLNIDSQAALKSVYLTDVHGRLLLVIHRNEIVQSSGKIDLSTLSKGIYFLHLDSENKTEVLRVCK